MRRGPGRLLVPFRERRFTFRQYERFLERLAAAAPRVAVVPLRELAAAEPGGRSLVSLRHDVDSRLDAALEMAALEHRHRVRATYFLLHSAGYYADRERVAEAARALQDELGHEVGLHNDFVTLHRLTGADPVAALRDELAWLREAGIAVHGTAAHGSLDARLGGYRNSYLFEECAVPDAERPNVEVVPRRVSLADVGLEYEAYSLPHERYLSDARFDPRGRRWHPRFLDLAALGPGERTIVLVHPDHWDGSLAAKAARTIARALRAVPGREQRG